MLKIFFFLKKDGAPSEGPPPTGVQDIFHGICLISYYMKGIYPMEEASINWQS